LTSSQVPVEIQTALITDLVKEKTSAELNEEDTIILKYAIKLTRTPSLIQNSDIESLRNVGLDDRTIHDVCAVTAYFNFVNRMASGLGVELEDRFP
jgi:uncharacterized peroxidase-related enzyme